MKVMFFGLILLVTAFSSVSQEIQSNGFSLALGKGWSVVNTNKTTTVAANKESEQVKLFDMTLTIFWSCLYMRGITPNWFDNLTIRQLLQLIML